eukprot:scaffold272407_cov37-Tisochrysis_lutea.AAC.6
MGHARGKKNLTDSPVRNALTSKSHLVQAECTPRMAVESPRARGAPAPCNRRSDRLSYGPVLCP